ncbi:adenylyl-sulfate kinase [Herpetosiphon giganteus]|uniref:adenylyl-sulfate kinase n=1 Tax=Herpetosiphon giganteus TaxID=2029754 RepID=UPI001956B1AC|nr:adenylyl-sulfate kinase [Herpetosiphon giganteus]MBM7846475.1 adenylyl-sulfate kinase [Herpetosiphon giganteus]
MSQGYIIWFTGLSGAGKSTIAAALAEVLREREQRVEVLDGDVVRTHLSKGLGFSKEDRDTNVRRIGWVCDLVARHGGVAIAAAISPYRQTREEIRSSTARFVEVYIDCPLEVCIDRDVKGLYAKALAGEIPHFTGVSDPYEPPTNPEVVIPSHAEALDASVARIINKLEELGYLPTVAAVEEVA